MAAGRPADRDPAQTRAAIVAAAGVAFARRGYHATSVREIAVTAGLTPAALRHHFGPKKDLYIAVAEEMQWRVHHQLEQIAAMPGTMMDRIAAVLGLEESLATTGRDDLQFLSSVRVDVMRHPELAPAVGRVPFGDVYRRIVASGLETGEIEQADVARLIRVLRVLLVGIGVQVWVDPATDLHGLVHDCISVVRGAIPDA